MVPEQLEPRPELLHEEYVLVKAWKKTASYIRHHNWFSDTLALDRAAVNLPASIGELRERLQSSESWHNDPLRIVPAPKSQRWRVREGVWEPVEKRATSARLRPLAHVRLADQVATTALQGDPRRLARGQESRRRVVSLRQPPVLRRHRWRTAPLAGIRQALPRLLSVRQSPSHSSVQSETRQLWMPMKYATAPPRAMTVNLSLGCRSRIEGF